MSKCETCARKQYGYLCDGCIHDPDNKDLYEPMTNADRIRSMTDEELAGFLMKLMGHAQCFAEGMFPYHPCPQNHNCKQCGVEWLQQPCEEGE